MLNANYINDSQMSLLSIIKNTFFSSHYVKHRMKHFFSSHDGKYYIDNNRRCLQFCKTLFQKHKFKNNCIDRNNHTFVQGVIILYIISYNFHTQVNSAILTIILWFETFRNRNYYFIFSVYLFSVILRSHNEIRTQKI